MERRQAEFVAEVEKYETGLFRGSFGEIGELLFEVGKALRDLPAVTGALVFTPIGRKVEVAWRTPSDTRDPFNGLGSPTLEMYLTPIGLTLGASRLRTAADVAPRMLREFGGVGQTAGIETLPGGDGSMTARAMRPPVQRQFSNQETQGGHIEGLAVGPSGEVCAWVSLRRDHFGAVVDAKSLIGTITPLVLLAAQTIGEIAGDTGLVMVPSIAVTGARSVSLGQPDMVGHRSSSTISTTGPSTLTLPGDESAILSAVVTGAADVAADLAARVVNALQTR
ncbi:MAG: hypothetical protein ACLPR9_09945 [Acidimicrobiales bacterium]